MYSTLTHIIDTSNLNANHQVNVEFEYQEISQDFSEDAEIKLDVETVEDEEQLGNIHFYLCNTNSKIFLTSLEIAIQPIIASIFIQIYPNLIQVLVIFIILHL